MINKYIRQIAKELLKTKYSDYAENLEFNEFNDKRLEKILENSEK